MDIIEKNSLIKLYSINGIGSQALIKLKRTYGSFQNAWQAGRDEWLTLLPELKSRVIGEAAHFVEDYEERLMKGSFDVITIDDDDYPPMLKVIDQAPYVLFYRGRIDVLRQLCLAVVGSRRASPYGRKTARELARDLAEEGVVVVSGLARGIDSEAHQGAVDGGGATVAVMGSGVDVVYPPENRRLYEKIQEMGAIVSEFIPGSHPEAHNFPRRNRIISGLSRGVVVVEARQKSGALITADFALEQGRDVFAVPGPVSSETSRGTNNLIKQGAKLAGSVQDILEEYIAAPPGRRVAEQQALLMLDRYEEEILKYISYEATHMNDILTASSMNNGLASTLLIKLELYGLIKCLPGNYYVRL
ncbi:MAG: DNA-processing protein DprA [Syntrophomonadaceae bacterium]